MAAFLPYDGEGTTPFDSNDHGNFLQTADDLNNLPPDLISPLPSYALYQEPTHYLSAPKPRLNPFDRIRQPSSQCQQNRQLYPPLPSSSSLSAYSYNYPSIDQVRCREASVDLDLSSPSLRTQSIVSSAVPLISPGLQLYETTSTSSESSSQFSRYSFPLTPPIDDPPSSNQSNSYLEWKPSPFVTLASGVSTSTLLPKSSTPFPPSNPFLSSTTSQFLSTDHPPTPLSQPSPNLPSSSSSHLRRVISAGIARRRTRNPYLASPALSCSSIFPLTSSKARTTNGGGRSRLSRDEVSIYCSLCKVVIATLQLRGKGNELDVEYRQDFVCFDCRPDLAGSPTDYELPHDTRVGYEATLSAHLDREQRVENQQRRRVVGSSVRVRKSSAGRRDPALELVTCDVCRNDVGSGGLRPQDSLEFTIEVVCLHCASLYRRCSDDGGGGGRLGVGKWRCKELFDEGRKNCSFSHARMGPIVDLTYDTHSLSTIHRDDLDRLNSICFEFFRTSLLSALAVPDVLEAESPIAISYEQIEKLSVDTWAHFDPFFRSDTATKGRRRYLGLRWATAKSRKLTKPARKAPTSPSSSFRPTQDLDQSHSILRPDLRLTGFTIMEVDEEQCLLFTPLSMPMGSVGDTYDASTTLLQRLSHHIAIDCDTVNVQRRQAGLASNRPIRDAWTVVLFSKDTRGANHLETRRGYVPLSTYSAGESTLSQQIHASLDDFLPVELQKGWQVFARPYGGASDDWGELIKSRRRRKNVVKTTSRPRRRAQLEDTSDEEEEELSDYVEESISPRKRSKR